MRYTRISADCHIDMPWLPPDLFTSNCSAALRACDGLLKADTWGSSIARFGLGLGCRPSISFRFRVIPGIPERSLIPG